ncbi:MAG: hypothetical protein WA691_10180 [Thermoplasmata archaeon]
MPFQRLTYHFATELAASRPHAYRWATDYRSNDFDLSDVKGRRKVEKLTDDLILLTDSFDDDPFDSRQGARTVKVKLVHLFPDRWMWTSTHVAGPAKYSQFLYQLTARGPTASTLHFTGNQVELLKGRPNRTSIQRRAQELKREDSHLWAQFSAALARELSQPAPKTG